MSKFIITAMYGIGLSLPFIGWSLFNLGATFGFDATYLFGSIIIFVFCLGIFMQEYRFNKAAVMIAGVLLLGTFLSSFAIYTNRDFSDTQYLKSVIHFLFYIFLFISLSSVDISAQTIRKLIYLTLFMGFFVSLYGIYQFFARMFDLPLAYLEFTTAHQGVHVAASFENIARISSFFSEPSWFGQYTAKLLVIVLIIYLERERQCISSNSIIYLLITLFIISIIMTLSMGTIAVLFAVLSLLWLMECRYRKKIRFGFFAIFLLMILGNLYLINNYSIDLIDVLSMRVTGLISGETVVGESAGERIGGINDAVASWSTNPLFGVGKGNFYWMSNYYFVALAEQGIIGFVCTLIFGIALLARLKKLFRYQLSADDFIIAKVLFYLVVTDLIYLNVISDLSSAKYFLDFSISLGFCNSVREKYQIVARG